MAGHDPQGLSQVVADLDIELVLTAHPTEVSRRTLIMKYDAIAQQLAALDHTDLTTAEREKIIGKLRRLIAEVWHTTEIRSAQPTPVDEARWGFAVIERSLGKPFPMSCVTSIQLCKRPAAISYRSPPRRFVLPLGWVVTVMATLMLRHV